MPLPASFRSLPVPVKPRFKGIMIGMEGQANTGKTELSWGGPGPGIQISLDRGHRAALDSATAPESRILWEGDNLLVIPVEAPLNTGVTQQAAKESWVSFYQTIYLPSLKNPDARTVIMDGDALSFEWQMLAEFGRTTMIPQIQRTGLNAARRVMIMRAADSGKVFISTNMVKKKYETVFDVNGHPVPDPEKPGQTLRQWDGVSYERQGFNDFTYGYDLQLRTLYEYETKQWGLQILMCKANRNLEGHELWGADCNLRALLEYVYPHVSAEEWGYEA